MNTYRMMRYLFHDIMSSERIELPGRGRGMYLDAKETMHVNMRADLMFENIEAIWTEIRQGNTKYLISCIYRPPSATTEYHEKIVDMFECAMMTEHPFIYLGDLNFNYIRDETLSIHAISYTETAYDMLRLIDQPTRVDDKTSSVLDVILTSHPALHRKSAVLQYTLSDHYLIYSHMEFENTKPSVVDHNTLNFVTWKISIWRVSTMI